MHNLSEVLLVLDRALHLHGKALAFSANTRLLGDLPEFDSMAVLALISGLENHFGIAIDDAMLTADRFSTVGSVCAMVNETLTPTGAR